MYFHRSIRNQIKLEEIIKQSLCRTLLAAAVLPAFLFATAPAALAKNSHVGEAIGAGIVGLAVGAALSKKHKHDTNIYYEGYQPPYPAGGYNAYWQQPGYSPAPGITCYDAQRACYSFDGGFANKWSRRVYGY